MTEVHCVALGKSGISVIDLTNKVVYYKTFDNNNIRMIDLKEIDFGKVKYQYQKLDEPNSQPVEVVTVSQ